MKILVTGTSKGLGLDIAKELLSRGFTVVGISRRDDSPNIILLKENNNYKHIAYNFKWPDDIKRFFKYELKELGPFDGFVNNAAFAYDDIITNCNYEIVQMMFNINVFSPIMLTKYIIRDSLLTKTKLNIVHISSISTRTGYKGLSMYASTKGALEAFSLNTAREWGSRGVRSNVVSPGFMATEMSSSLSREQRDKIFKRNSKREELETSEVAKTVKFLVSNDSSGITGQIINVDNGTI
jgi:3-oxoacyl-[acyl-carrier protein] reductase